MKTATSDVAAARHRYVVFDLVNSQWKNHTMPHTPHVQTVRTRCTVCAPPVIRFLAVVGPGGGAYTYCGGGGVSPGSCGIVMRHSVDATGAAGSGCCGCWPDPDAGWTGLSGICIAPGRSPCDLRPGLGQ